MSSQSLVSSFKGDDIDREIELSRDSSHHSLQLLPTLGTLVERVRQKRVGRLQRERRRVGGDVDCVRRSSASWQNDLSCRRLLLCAPCCTRLRHLWLLLVLLLRLLLLRPELHHGLHRRDMQLLLLLRLL